MEFDDRRCCLYLKLILKNNKKNDGTSNFLNIRFTLLKMHYNIIVSPLTLFRGRVRIPTIRQHDNPASKTICQTTIRQMTIRQQTICQHDNPPTLKKLANADIYKKKYY
jgi:hypothetical protein